MARMSVLYVGSLFGFARNSFAPALVVATWPSNKSGATATKPSWASRSQTLLQKSFSPHQAWMTSTPLPFPDGGTAMYVFADGDGFIGICFSVVGPGKVRVNGQALEPRLGVRRENVRVFHKGQLREWPRERKPGHCLQIIPRNQFSSHYVGQ